MTVEKVKEIKQSFRQIMDGAVAKSQRDKGLHYQLNWGATLPRLREMADELRREADEQRRNDAAAEGDTTSLYDLSIALWKEDVRECKILATMLMPPTEILPEVADIWMEQTPSQEIAEQAAFNLWQHVPYAGEQAFRWIALDKEYYQLCGFNVLTRLFMRGTELESRTINEYIDQTICALQGPYPAVRKAALLSIQRFAGLGLVYQRMAQSALRQLGLSDAAGQSL